MSSIPEARKLLVQAQMLRREADDLTRKAMKLMTREKYVRKANTKYVRVTPAMRSEIWRLSRDKAVTMAQIANAVGLRNSGRVSEILNGRR